MEIRFPRLTNYQQNVYEWLGDPYQTGKIAVIKSVRQSGKSFFCMVELISMALLHPGCTSAIVEPTLAQSRNVYKNIVKALDGTGLIKNANAQTLDIDLTNGSSILFRSTQQGDANRGYTVTGLLILDECAYLIDESIYTILPLVNAHNAPILICSTPFIQEGYYYNMFMMGLEERNGIKSFDWAKDPEISRFLTEERKAFYKQTMSRQKYRTEVEGEFLTDDGLLFSGLDNCIGLPDGNKTLYIGIDFGTGSEGDYTVMVALNNHGQMVKMYRTNNLTPTQQIEWITELLKDLNLNYTIRTILAEENSIGKVYIDALKKNLSGTQIRITNWTTSNKSKQDLVTQLQIALENQYITILDEPILLNELKRYQADVNPKTKTVTYNGIGGHDDTVMALMFAWWAYKKGMGTFSISFAGNNPYAIK